MPKIEFSLTFPKPGQPTDVGTKQIDSSCESEGEGCFNQLVLASAVHGESCSRGMPPGALHQETQDDAAYAVLLRRCQ